LQIEMERKRLSPQVGLNLEHQCVETHLIVTVDAFYNHCALNEPRFERVDRV
jgi:hypothetical protein